MPFAAATAAQSTYLSIALSQTPTFIVKCATVGANVACVPVTCTVGEEVGSIVVGAGQYAALSAIDIQNFSGIVSQQLCPF